MDRNSVDISNRIMLIFSLTILCFSSVSMATEEKDVDLRQKINDLKNNMKILHNLTAHLTTKVQNYISEEHTTHICQNNPCQNSGICQSSVNFNSFTCTNLPSRIQWSDLQ